MSQSTAVSGNEPLRSLGGQPDNRGTWAEHGHVVAQYFLVADLRIDQGHADGGVAEHLHDDVELRAALNEPGADGVPETVGRDSAASGASTTARPDQSGRLSGALDRRLEQVEGRQKLAVAHE